MLSIVNVTPKGHKGKDLYEVRVNSDVIAIFEHGRVYCGAAQCLRDAADAIEDQRVNHLTQITQSLIPAYRRREEK